MSKALEDGTWLCKPCNRVFPTWESLLQHKKYKQTINAEDHIHCSQCGQDFATQYALRRHTQQSHPREQALRCPGCGRGPFSRLASLMEHIEDGDCPKLDSSSLDAAREKKLDFTKRLAAMTNEPVKNDYSKFVSHDSVTESFKSVRIEPEKPGFKMIDSEFPSLSAGQSANENKKTSHAGDHSEPSSPKAWKGKENLFPNAASVQRPTTPQLEAATRPSETTLFESMDCDDPVHPAFSAEKYYSDIMEQYICPKLGCGKVFKSSVRLVGHLNSPAHGNKTYRCPYCLKTFKSLTAITSHVESSSVNCRIRETDSYGAYLDQLTAGIVNVEQNDEDGNIRYATTDSAWASFGQKKRVDAQRMQKTWFW